MLKEGTYKHLVQLNGNKYFLQHIFTSAVHKLQKMLNVHSVENEQHLKYIVILFSHKDNNSSLQTAWHSFTKQDKIYSGFALALPVACVYNRG